MLPLSHDIRRYYRRYATSTSISNTGDVTEITAVDGPYSLAFRSGGTARTRGEQGYTYETETYLVIADGCRSFKAGDVLTEDSAGDKPLYKVLTARTYPTEQQLIVRAV